MKAIISAAGEGSRMRPLTYTRPKVMLPVANCPILEHLLVELRGAGIEEFIFIVGYHDELVRNYFGDGKRWGVTISYCNQRRQLGTADALRAAEGLVKEPFLLVNGDIMVGREDISRIIKQDNNTLAVVEVDDVRELGVVELSQGRVSHIYEKMGNPPSHMVNAGLYRFTPDIFGAVSRTPPSSRGEYELTDSLQLMIDEGCDIGYQQISRWLNLSYPWDLLSANQSLLKEVGEQRQGEIEDGAVIKGKVSVGRNTIVRSGSYIVGPVIIGQDGDIGPNCYIRADTSIGDGCRIGNACEVKASIIMNGSKLPHHNYVGDSVIGEGCNLGSGTKIANLRLDGKNVIMGGVDTGRRKLGAIVGDGVEAGINATINLGSVIGNNTFIGPGAVVSGVILPNSRIY
ncbi:MAG: NTP transferase domain-containing protein [Dehalococcoidales bacterium]|nr:NTP transferase domain-containing protein [Dehalococcoidales bacterium]